MIPFPFNENRFSFFFVADHLLVGQLCTNPKSDRSLLSCLKVTQCSTSEIGDAPLYNWCPLPIQVMTTGPLPAPSKCKSGLPRITGTSQGDENKVSGYGHGLWCGFKCTCMCWRVWWSPGAIRWPVADPGCGCRTRRRPTSPKRPWLGFRRSATTLYPSLTGHPPPPTWTRWTTSFGPKSRKSPTWPPTTPKPAWPTPSAEYSPSSRRRL